MKKGNAIIVAVGALLLTAIAGAAMVAQSRKSAEELYQSALVMKEGRGDLEAAIKLLARILSEYPKDRVVTGKAQLQIGLCYEKLGETKAQEAYNKVIAEFQDQPEVVKIARERLAGLAKPAAAAGPASSGMVLRQVDLPYGKISPDGRWIASGLSAIPSIEPNITLLEIETKKQTLITSYKSENGGFPYIGDVMWGAKGDKIAYVLWEDEKSESAHIVSSIHIVDLTGANDRIVYRISRPLTSMSFSGWTKDQRTMFVILLDNSGPRQKYTIGNLAIETGEFRTIKTFEGARIGNALLSPDGRMIACSYSPDRQTIGNPRLILIDPFSGAETTINDHPQVSYPSAWTPESDSLIFTSDRSGTPGLWVVPIRDGQAAGKPRLIREFFASVRALGMANRSLYLNESDFGGMDVFIADIDLVTGKTLKVPEPIEKDYRGVTIAPSWSPDGQKLAYLYQSSRRRTSAALGGETYDILRIRELRTNEFTDFRSPVKLARMAKWSADGNSIFLYGAMAGPAASSPPGLFRINARTGETTLILEYRQGGGTVQDITGDGKAVYLAKMERGATISEGVSSLARLEIETRVETGLYRAASGEMLGGVSLSQDEHWLGINLRHRNQARRFLILPAQGGDVKEPVITLNESLGSPFFFNWGPPGKGILYQISKTEGERSFREIWHVASLEKPDPRMLELKVGNIYVPPGIVFNPNGKTVAFQSSGEFVSKRWILENFLPPAKSEK